MGRYENNIMGELGSAIGKGLLAGLAGNALSKNSGIIKRMHKKSRYNKS
jgi:hypothetical protein